MTHSFLQLGKGPAIDFQIRDRKGKLVQSLAIPEEHVTGLFRAVTLAGGRTLPAIDLYGDTTLSHDMCKRALSDCQAGLRAITDPNAHTCAAAIVDAIARVADDAALNLFVVGN